MDGGGGGQAQDGHQRQGMEQQQQQHHYPGMWYGGSHYGPYQVPYKWPGHDPSTPHGGPYGGPNYCMQGQQYGPPVLHGQALQSQHHGFYNVQQEQAGPSSNGWYQPQWNLQGGSTVSQEEDWAAKARAWTAAKAAQEAAQQAQAHMYMQQEAQTGMMPSDQQYEEYHQQETQPAHHVADAARPLPSVQPPGHTFSLEAPANIGLEPQSFQQEALANYGQEDAPPTMTQEGAPSAYLQADHAQVVPSSYPQDVSSNYGQDSAHAAPPGTLLSEQTNAPLSRPPPAPFLQPQLSQPSAQVPSVFQPHQVSDQDPALASSFETHQQVDLQQNTSPDYQQTSSTPFIPPASPMPAVGVEGPDMTFGGLQNGMSVWPPHGSSGISYPPGIGNPSGPQFDHPSHPLPHNLSHPIHVYQPSNMFPRPHGPPQSVGFRPRGLGLGGPFGLGGTVSLGQNPAAGVVPVFLLDGNRNVGGSDRPKKAPVPSWLREELLKKKSAVGASVSTVVQAPEDFSKSKASETVPVVSHQVEVTERTRSGSSGVSDNEENDEDDAEVARTTQITQEIKRVLTEVLLKVTDELFDEIAHEVMREDEQVEEGQSRQLNTELDKSETVRNSSYPSPPSVPSNPTAARVLVSPAKRMKPEDDGNSVNSGSPVVNVLGLASYASDDEDADRDTKRNLSPLKLKASELCNSSVEGEERSLLKPSLGDTRKTRESRQGASRLPKDKESNMATSEKHGKDRVERREALEKYEKPAQETTNMVEWEMRKEELERDVKWKESENERARTHEERSHRRYDMERKDTWCDMNERKRRSQERSSGEQDQRSYRRARHTGVASTKSSDLGRRVEETDSVGAAASVATNEAQGQSNSDHRPKGAVVQAGQVGNNKELVVGIGQSQVVTTREGTKADLKNDRLKISSPFVREELTTVPVEETIGPALVSDLNNLKDSGDVSRDRSKHRNRDVVKEHNGKGAKGKAVRERDRESEKFFSKERSRESERWSEKDKARVGSKDSRRSYDRDRDRARGDRGDRSRDKPNESREARRSRRRSSSTSSRGRSLSLSRDSSSDDNRSRSQKSRRLGRSIRWHNVSRSPVRSRRSSRPRSRSPPNKSSHRRHSPSPSLEGDRST